MQVSDFDALMTSKNDQLDAARTALTDKAEENGARGQSLSNVEARRERACPGSTSAN